MQRREDGRARAVVGVVIEDDHLARDGQREIGIQTPMAAPHCFELLYVLTFSRNLRLAVLHALAQRL